MMERVTRKLGGDMALHDLPDHSPNHCRAGAHDLSGVGVIFDYDASQPWRIISENEYRSAADSVQLPDVLNPALIDMVIIQARNTDFRLLRSEGV